MVVSRVCASLDQIVFFDRSKLNLKFKNTICATCVCICIPGCSQCFSRLWEMVVAQLLHSLCSSGQRLVPEGAFWGVNWTVYWVKPRL